MQSNAIRVQQRKDFVSCLPADVLILIFEQSIVALDNNVSWNTASVHEAALERRGEFKGSSLFRVSHVSRTWRDIAIGCPSLWSKFALRLNCMTNVDSSLLSLYLKRSRSCLLDMDLTIGFYDPFSLSQTSARHLWTSVIAAIARWRRVSITVNQHFNVHPIAVSLQSLCAPCLEQLSIVATDDDDILDDDEELDETPRSILQGGAPKVTNLILIGLDLNRYYPSLSGLRELRLTAGNPAHGMSYTRLLEVLRSSPGLERLCLSTHCLDVSTVDHATSVNFHSIQMPSLLEFQYIDYVMVRGQELPLFYMLPVIDAPNLDRLVLHFGDFRSSGRMCRYLGHNAAPKFPKVTYLEVAGSRIQDLMRIPGSDLMSSTPALTTLVLRDKTATGTLSEFYARETRPTLISLWRNLREIIILDKHCELNPNRSFIALTSLIRNGRVIQRLWLEPMLYRVATSDVPIWDHFKEARLNMQDVLRGVIIEDARIFQPTSMPWRG